MKKLLLVAAIAIVGYSANIHAGKTAKKVWAYYKILHGIGSIPLTVVFPAVGFCSLISLNNSDDPYAPAPSAPAVINSFLSIGAGPGVFIPLAVLCIKSGLRDLKKLKKNDVPVVHI